MGDIDMAVDEWFEFLIDEIDLLICRNFTEGKTLNIEMQENMNDRLGTLLCNDGSENSFLK